MASAVLVIEIFFRVAGALGTWNRGDEDLGDEHFVILCVGDSHTWGLGKGYPLRLSTRLAQRSTRYRVINFGVPGANTAQLRKRFVGYLERYQPRIVVLWSGMNNFYNRADSDVWEKAGVERASLGRKLLDYSRTLRLLRVWRNQIELRRHLDSEDAYVLPESTRPKGDPRNRRRLLGPEDVFERLSGGALTVGQVARVTELDIRFLVEEARKRNVPIVAINYGRGAKWSLAAQEGILAAARATGAILVDSADAVTRLRDRYIAQAEEVPDLYIAFKGVHPTQVLYEEIGDLVLERLDAHGLLPLSEQPSRARFDNGKLSSSGWHMEEIARTISPQSPIGRFLTAADECKRSEFSVTIGRSVYGLPLSFEYYLAVRSPSAGKCTIFFRLDHVTRDVVEWLEQQELSEERLAEIEQVHASLEASLKRDEGREGTCVFLSGDSWTTLVLWQAGKTDLTRHAECTGLLFERRLQLGESEMSGTLSEPGT